MQVQAHTKSILLTLLTPSWLGWDYRGTKEASLKGNAQYSW